MKNSVLVRITKILLGEFMYKILVVEDEKNISNIIKYNLEKDGYEVYVADDGVAGLDKYKEVSPHLVLLDIMMPKMDGYEVCTEIRKSSNVPIIMLTARAEESDKVMGLELGADDYVTKPFSIKELSARVKANLRRVPEDSSSDEGNTVTIGELTIAEDKFDVIKNGQPLNLTRREFDLVYFLIKNRPKVITREQLLEDVWGYEYYGDLRTVDVTMRRLRAKLEDDSLNPKYLQTKRGSGYYFEMNV